MGKVQLSRQVLEYAFSDQYLLERSISAREIKRDLKRQLEKEGRFITARRLRKAVNAFSDESQKELARYLNRRRSGNNAWRTMVLLLTLPNLHKVAAAYCDNAKESYTPQDIADILDEKDNVPISGALDDFRRKKGPELFRWSNQAVHLRWRRITGAHVNEWWISLDEDKDYEGEKVQYVIFYVPKDADVAALLKHPKLKTVRELCDLWSAKVWTVISPADALLDVVIGRQSATLHSRYFMDGKEQVELSPVFLDKTLAPISF